MTVMAFRVRAAACSGLVVLSLLVGAACGGPQEPGEEGALCYRDADCQVGLVCVPNGNERHCSKDIGGLVSQVERPPPDAGMPMGDAGEEPVDGG
jgi:hypothetical protein